MDLVTEVPTVDSVVSQAKVLFNETFCSKSTVTACAPGRVNLIGEHTDYNAGFVFPMALPQVTIVTGSICESDKCSVVTASVSEDQIAEFYPPSHDNPLTPGKPIWANYVKGIVANFKGDVPAFNAAIVSSVPLGGGVSSSASLEVAMYTFLEALTGNKTSDLKQKALACQKAEHDFAGMPCGIMDQFISVMAKKGNALLIDCRSMESTLVPMLDSSIVVLITNSNIRHELTGSEYPERRKQCEDAARLLGKKSLREVTIQELEEIKNDMDEVTYRRARHVINEINRTTTAAEMLKKQNYTGFGKLMHESHVSLRDDFEVSCPELDALVDAAMQCDGVFGSRMTGGGFGGCTVTLLQDISLQSVLTHIKKLYAGNPTFYVSHAADGARILTE